MSDSREKVSKAQSVASERRILRGITIILIILLLLVGIKGSVSVLNLKSEQSKVEKNYDDLKVERDDLRQELKHINTSDYIEQTARDMLKMVMPGEILYIIKDRDSENNQADTSNNTDN